MNNPIEINPREVEMNRPLDDEIIIDYYDPEKPITLMSVETHTAEIEHEVITALLNLARNASRDSDKRAAASDLAEIIGRKGKNVQVIQGKNIQVNQIASDPDLKRHLIESAKGLKALTDASDSKVKSKFGGEGV